MTARLTLHLHGSLKARYGGPFSLVAATPLEAVRGLAVQLPGFWTDITKGVWRFAWGRNEADNAMPAHGLTMWPGRRKVLHIQPALEGAARGGAGKLILGSLIFVAAIGLAAFTGGASIAAAGAATTSGSLSATIAAGLGMSIAGTGITLGQVALFGALTAVGGLAQMLSATPSADLGRLADRRESFLFDQPLNVAAEGAAIPLIYGRPGRVGSVVVSSGVAVERLPVLAEQDSADQTGGAEVDPADLFQTNATFSPPAEGAGVGGGKGGQTFVASEDPNTIQARETARFVDVLGNGEHGGLVNGLQSYYLDGTPVQNADGSLNFQGIRATERIGLPDQEVINGFPSVEAEVAVGVEVTQSTSVTRTITDPDADAARIKIRMPSLTEQDTSTGDLHGSSVEVAIDRKDPGGDFVEQVRATITEKTTSDYTEAYRIDLPGAGPWDIRVRRISADADTVAVNNQTFFSSYTRIIDQKFTYAGRFVIASEANAELFGGRIPRREWDVWGRIVQVPSNYNPFTRTYTGIWDGSFVRNWTDNPAWVFYDLLTDGRDGLGRFVEAAEVSKFDLYAIARYCDEMVSDGKGGTEPRWTFNAAISTRRAALAWLMTVASAWHGLAYWGPGVVSATADKPADAVQLVVPANTIGGRIEPGEAPLSAQHSTVLVRFRDPDQDFQPDVAVVEDRDRLARFGYREMEVDALWCRSRGMAIRYGRTILADEDADTTYNWVAGLDHLNALPGEVVRIRDAGEVGVEAGGRVASATTAVVTLDRDVTLEAGKSYTLSVHLTDGSLAERDVTTSPSTTDVLTVDPALPSIPAANAVWALVGEDDVLARILQISEEAVNQYAVTAVKYDPGRYSRIETGLKIETPQGPAIPTGPLPTVSGFTVEEYLVKVGSAIIPAASFGFSPSPDGRVRLYEGALKRPGDGSFQRIGQTSAPRFDIRDVLPGIHVLRVRSIARDGSPGPWAEFQKSLLGAASPPADVTGFRADRIASSTRLSWDRVTDFDLAGYRVRHSGRTTGARWADGLAIAEQLPAAAQDAVVPTLKGTYMIRAIDFSGSLSRSAALVVIDRDAEDLNAVATIDEFPTLAGARTNVDIASGALQAAEDGSGNVYTTGRYKFSNTLDLGQVYTSRVTASMEVEGVDIGEVMANWTSLASIGALAGVAEDGFSAVLEMRTTEDDPAGSPVWTEWKPLRVGDVTARAFEWRIEFASTQAKAAARVTACTVNVDMPDRIAAGGDISADAAGESVAFGTAFKATPVISVTGQDMATGDYFEVTNKSRTGFDVRFFNSSGTGIARTFDYVAAGYGEEAV